MREASSLSSPIICRFKGVSAEGLEPKSPDPGLSRRVPRVSVIIIFLNEERFLCEAVESVCAQTFGDWELFLGDDGSTDASAAIAQQLAATRPDRITYLTHAARENRGMSASRKLGLALARSEFVAFLDADDRWFPDKLERQIGLFAEHPDAQMVCGATQ